MKNLTLYDLPEVLQRGLRRRAQQNNRPVEAEVLDIIRQAVGEAAGEVEEPAGKAEDAPSKGLATGIREIVERYGEYDLEIPPRERMLDPRIKFE